MANVANVKRKPVTIELDKTRQLKYTLNSFAEMEDAYGSVDEALKLMEKGNMKAIRFMLWAGLMHEDETLTVTKVGNLIEIADLQELSTKMNQVMNGDLPDKTESPNDQAAQASVVTIAK